MKISRRTLLTGAVTLSTVAVLPTFTTAKIPDPHKPTGRIFYLKTHFLTEFERVRADLEKNEGLYFDTTDELQEYAEAHWMTDG
jgi:hypothetical protein